MSARKTLRLLIIAQWVLTIVGVALSELLADQLPEQLREYLAWEASKDLTTGAFVTLAIALVLITLWLLASVALFRFWEWGRWLYAVTTAFLFVLSPFAGPTVHHAIEDLAGDLHTLIFGLIIGITYFGQVFSNGQDEAPEITPGAGSCDAAWERAQRTRLFCSPIDARH